VICLEARPTCFAAGIVAAEGVVADLDAVAKIVHEKSKDRVAPVVRALTQYAATLDKDGAPRADWR
jgi:hypothetical protein